MKAFLIFFWKQIVNVSFVFTQEACLKRHTFKGY